MTDLDMYSPAILVRVTWFPRFTMDKFIGLLEINCRHAWYLTGNCQQLPQKIEGEKSNEKDKK